MKPSDRPGFFRGAERSKLLILAGLMLVGWPAVLYYGFTQIRGERPKPAPIVEQPPLPPADESPEFAPVLDVTRRTFRDDDALALLLRKSRENRPETWRREVTPLDMLKTPRRYRGLPIRLEGFASQVFAVDDQDASIAPGRRIYEVWIRSSDHDQRMYPCCLIAESVPPTLPGGRNLDEPIAFEGYFLKLLQYRAGDAERFAPMLVGRLAHAPLEVGPGARPSRVPWIPILIGLLVLYLSIRLLFAFRRAGAPRRALRTGRSPESHIEPEALDRWIAASEGDEEPSV